MKIRFRLRRRPLAWCALCTIVLFALAAAGPAQKGAKAQPDPSTQEPQKRQSRGAVRRAAYAQLKKLVGDFDATYSIPFPGGVFVSSCKVRGKSLFGGRFARLAVDVDVANRKITHEFTIGYDSYKRRFDLTWFSGARASTVRATGQLVVRNGIAALEFQGEMEDATRGKRTAHHSFQFLPDGQIVFVTTDRNRARQTVQEMEIRFVRARPVPSPEAKKKVPE